MTPDDELRTALRDAERLSPDLDAVRRTVLDDRGRRRDRHRWWATGLVAGCVLVISGAVAMSAIGVDEQRAGRDASATAATPTPVPTPARSSAAGRSGTSTGPARPSDPGETPDRPTDVGTAPLDLSATGDPGGLSGRAEDAVRHCHGRVIAWPLVSGGEVHERALRSAVNECAVEFGDRTVVATRYTIARFDAVASGTGLWAGTAGGTVPPDAVDTGHPILVVRLEGTFPALAQDGAAPPTAVQIYVDAAVKCWAGIQFRSPVDPAGLGGVVTVLPG